MDYTRVPSKIKIELDELLKKSYDFSEIKKNPSLFAIHILGIKPYYYQHMILRRFRDLKQDNPANRRIIICKSRQIGISVCLMILAIWYASCNKKPSGIHNNTKVGIISRDDKSSKKFMNEVQKLIWNSKREFHTFVKRGRSIALNKSELNFENDCSMKCFPPTDASRGESFDLVIGDEAAFIEDEIFKDVIEPTVSATDGKIILSSTPNGQKGFFYELFDPNDLYDEHEYYRYYFKWDMCENEIQRKLITEKLKYAKKTGNMKSFDQEYNAQFTIDKEAFFEDGDVERGIDKNLINEYESTELCSIGVDYGRSDSATCITVVALDRTIKGGACIKRLFQFAEVNIDENKLMDKAYEHSIPNMFKRYKNIKYVVVDDCAQGTRTNKQLENEGYPVVRFNFRSDQSSGERNRGYYVFRAALKQYRVKYPNDRNMIAEMKYLQEESLSSFTRIKSPRGYKDDRIDSFMMACYPFLNEVSTFQSTVLDYKEVITDLNKRDYFNPRADREWERLKEDEKIDKTYFEVEDEQEENKRDEKIER